MSITENHATAGRVGAHDRALAPDLARGLMLALTSVRDRTLIVAAGPWLVLAARTGGEAQRQGPDDELGGRLEADCLVSQGFWDRSGG
jgi:hypothetical protein